MTNNNEDLPDWLQDVPPDDDSADRLEIEEPTEGPPPDWMRAATSARGSSLTEDNTPDWLKAVRAGRSPSKEPEAPKTEPAAPEGLSDLERLLAEEGIDLGSVSEERPKDAGGMSARDWLIASSSDEIIRKRVGSEPMASPPAPKAEVPKPQPPAPKPEPPKPQPPAPKPEPPQPQTSSLGDKMVVEEDLPDWLRDFSEEEEPAEPPFELPVEAPAPPSGRAKVYTPPDEGGDKMVVEEDLPDWLRDFSEEEEPAPAEPGPIPGTPAPVVTKKPGTGSLREDKMVVEEDLPDWLRDISEEEVPEPVPPAKPMSEQPGPGIGSAEEEMPNWLRDVAEETSPPAPAAGRHSDGMIVEEDLPDWLREVEEESIDLATISETEEPEFASRASGAEEQLPDWLREVEERTAETEPFAAELGAGETEEEEAGLPDWLKAVQEGAAPEPAPVAGSSDLIVEEELPDWLKEMEGETPEEAVPPLPRPAAEQRTEIEPEALEALPDWLKEMQYEEGPATAFDLEMVAGVTGTVEDIIDEEGLPDWLQEVEEEVFEPSEPSPEPFADVYAEEGIPPQEEEEEEGLVIEEELPDWLREVEVKETPTVEEVPSRAEPVPMPAVAAEPGLIDEEMLPDWLREIEEEEEEEAVIPSAEAAEPVPTVEAVLPPVAVEAKAEEALVEWSEELPELEDLEVEVTPLEELPDWLQGLEEELELEEVSLPEPVAEAPSVAEPEPPVTPEPPTPELPVSIPTPEPQPMPVVEPVRAVPVPVVEQAPTGMPDWLKKLREGFDEEAEPVRPRPLPRPVPVPPPAPRPEPAVIAAQPVEVAIEAGTPDLPADAAERLKLARSARDRGEMEEAIHIYDSLVTSGVYLDKIIEDMQQAIKAHPSNYLIFQLMGDAMMKDGRLQSALDAYRQALARL